MQTLTLTQFCQCIHTALDVTMPDSYWVCAEVSSLSERNGHCYMELVDHEGQGAGDTLQVANGNLTAKLQAVCWANTWRLIRAYFQQETGTNLVAGMQVLMEVRVNYHPVYGLKVNVENIDPSYTVGSLKKQRDLTIERLEKEGVIDMNRSLALPRLVRRIAVISSDSAAGYGDFCHQIAQSDYAKGLRLTLFPAIVQGDSAPKSIIRALEQVAEVADEYDMVVIIRGGGATTDLTCFDDYQLAAHCAQFPIPILSGIGHTRDVSVVDMVAYESVKTPTAAAEWLIARMDAEMQVLMDYERRVREVATQMVLRRKNQIDSTEMRIKMLLQNMLTRQQMQLQQIEQHIQLRSPEKIFRMGYSLTRVNGEIVRKAAALHPGDVLTTAFADGEVESVVR